MRDLLEKIDLIINEKENKKSKEEEEGQKVRDFWSGRSASEYDKNLLALVQALPDNPSWKQIDKQMDKALGLDPPGFSFDEEDTNRQNFMKMLGAVNGLKKILVPGGDVIDTKTGKKQSYHQLKGTSAFKKILSAQNAKGMIPVEFQKNKEIMADLGGQRINHGIKNSTKTGSVAKSGPTSDEVVPGAGLSARPTPATPVSTGSVAKSGPNYGQKADKSSTGLTVDSIVKMSPQDIKKLKVTSNNYESIKDAIFYYLKKYYNSPMTKIEAKKIIGKRLFEADIDAKELANDRARLEALASMLNRYINGPEVDGLIDFDKKFASKMINDINGAFQSIDAIAKNTSGAALPQSAVAAKEPQAQGGQAQDGQAQDGQAQDGQAQDSIKGQMQTPVNDVAQLAGPMQQQVQQFVKNYLRSDARTKQWVVNYLQTTIDPLKPKTPDQKQQGPPAADTELGRLRGQQRKDLSSQTLTVNPAANTELARLRPNQSATSDTVTVSNSTDFNDLLKLAGTKQLTEASMNISMNGNTSAEVAELMNLLKNAGLDDAKPVADLGMFKTVDEPAPCPMCAAAHGADSPCGEAVEEEWDNSPDEEYQDDEYMIHDLSGGINRKKERAAQRVKDPAVATESKFKSMLKSSLEEMYQKKRVDEKDPFARLKQATGTGMGGKQHSQYKQFANKTPMKIGPAKAPGANGIAGALAKGPGMAAAPKAAAVPTAAAAPKATLTPDTHAMLKSVFPKQYAPERAQRLYDILDQKTGDAMSWLRKKTGKL